MLQMWHVEGQEDDDSGSDYKAPKKPARGATQSKVPGEINPDAHERARERKVKSYVAKNPNLVAGKKKVGGTR